MKASIGIDKNGVAPKLFGNLGIPNEPYTAYLVIDKPDGSTDNLVVPHSESDAWSLTVTYTNPGAYEALIMPRVEGAFESTRLQFSL